MTYTVELRYIGDGDCSDLARDMQAWLHRNRIDPEEFRHSSGPPGVAFRVDFSDRGQAARFAAAFRGWLECGDPQGTGRRWIDPRVGGVVACGLPRSD